MVKKKKKKKKNQTNNEFLEIANKEFPFNISPKFDITT